MVESRVVSLTWSVMVLYGQVMHSEDWREQEVR